MFERFHQHTEFQQIAQIIEKNDVSDIPELKHLILRNPDCLVQTNLKNETLLHLAAENSYYEIFNEILIGLGDKIQYATKRFTEDGLLPIHYATENAHTDKNRIYKKLEDILLSTPFKPIKEAINFEKIILENIDEIRKDKSLLFKLHYAWIAASFARKVISFSFTHMSANSLNDSDFKKLSEASGEFENVINQAFQNIAKMHFQSNDEENLFKLNQLSHIISNNHMGNCLDYSILVLLAFKLMGIKGYPVIYALKDTGDGDNSDHAFTMLFNNKRDDDFRNWKNEIVIDAWSGEIFLSPSIVDKLNDLKTVESLDGSRIYNLACPFNPSLQTLTIDPTFNFSEEFWKHNTTNDFSFFADIEDINANFHFIQRIWDRLVAEEIQAHSTTTCNTNKSL